MKEDKESVCYQNNKFKESKNILTKFVFDTLCQICIIYVVSIFYHRTILSHIQIRMTPLIYNWYVKRKNQEKCNGKYIIHSMENDFKF